MTASTQALAKPLPGAPLSFTPALALSASRAETVGWIVQVTPGAGLPCPGDVGAATVSCYALPPVTTSSPSTTVLPAGPYYDPTVPTSSLAGALYEVDVAVKAATAAGNYTFAVGDLPVSLKVWPMTMPARPNHPGRAELEPGPIMSAHGIPSTANVCQEIALYRQYIALARAHFIDPVKIDRLFGLYPPTDITNDYGCGASWKSVVIDGAIADPSVFGWVSSPAPSVASLTATAGWIANGSFPQQTRAWVWDEGQGTLDAQTLARVQLVAANAPNLVQMLTREDTPSMDAYNVLYFPVMDWFNQPGHVAASAYGTRLGGLYTSCMATGSCSNGSTGKPSGAPLFIIDAASVNQRAFPAITAALAGQWSESLYYDLDHALSSAWSAGGQYYAGGNGDGTLLYPGDGTHGPAGTPIASLRLKNWRDGIEDAQYLDWAMALDPVGTKAALAKMVTSGLAWDRTYSDWLALRAQFGAIAAAGVQVSK